LDDDDGPIFDEEECISNGGRWEEDVLIKKK
jgi:hypothetical protein